MDITETDIVGAVNAVNVLGRELDEVRRKTYGAEAVVIGLTLLKYSAGSYPGVTGWYYSWESEYDDEGGYFDSTYVRPEVDEDVAGHREAVEEFGQPEEDYDNLDVWGKDSLEVLFGSPETTLSVQDVERRIGELSEDVLQTE